MVKKCNKLSGKYRLVNFSVNQLLQNIILKYFFFHISLVEKKTPDKAMRFKANLDWGGYL